MGTRKMGKKNSGSLYTFLYFIFHKTEGHSTKVLKFRGNFKCRFQIFNTYGG